MPAERSAIVVGGGIGGLAAALALRRAGLRVTVLERARRAGEVGAGITLFPNALRGLDAIGVGERVRAAGFPLPAGNGTLRRPDGRVVIDATGLPVVRDLYGFHRAALHAALLDELTERAGDDVIVTGAEVVSVAAVAADQVRAKAEVELASGDRLAADVVVGADGLRSRVRSVLHPEQPGPRYAGYTSWRGVTRDQVELPGGAGETWGAGRRFGILPLRDGRAYWFGAANRAEGAGDAGPMDAVRERFAGWHDPIPALLAATDPAAVLHYDIYDLPTPLAPFARGRVALLGDAAHAMTPDIGQGACQAIEDAVTLAAVLAGSDDVADALAEYDAARRPRTQRLLRIARLAGRFGQAQAPLAVRLRSLALRLTPPSAALGGLSRVTDWTPPALPA